MRVRFRIFVGVGSGYFQRLIQYSLRVLFRDNIMVFLELRFKYFLGSVMDIFTVQIRIFSWVRFRLVQMFSSWHSWGSL